VLDLCSSSRWFDGYAEPVPPDPNPAPTHRARTWLLSIGWRRHRLGLIRLDERPADARTGAPSW
jgi:hypothetical protein